MNFTKISASLGVAYSSFDTISTNMNTSNVLVVTIEAKVLTSQSFVAVSSLKNFKFGISIFFGFPKCEKMLFWNGVSIKLSNAMVGATTKKSECISDILKLQFGNVMRKRLSPNAFKNFFTFNFNSNPISNHFWDTPILIHPVNCNLFKCRSTKMKTWLCDGLHLCRNNYFYFLTFFIALRVQKLQNLRWKHIRVQSSGVKC